MTASRPLQSSLGARTGRDQHEQALQGEHLPGGYEFYLRRAMALQTPMCTCVKRVKIERNAHQDAIVTDSRALKRSLCSRTGRDQHEQAFQGKRLPSGNDITAAAAQRTQQAQQLQRLPQHRLVQNRRQGRLERLRLCFCSCAQV